MQGKTVLITGGNTGIGQATAIGLGRRGARVVFTARDAGKGEAAARHIRAETGPRSPGCCSTSPAVPPSRLSPRSSGRGLPTYTCSSTTPG